MKAYGFSRKDTLTCKYGCCTMKENNPAHKKVFGRQNAKTARQEGKKDANLAVNEGPIQD